MSSLFSEKDLATLIKRSLL